MKNQENKEKKLQEQDGSSYTENEIEFADGKGTQLDEESENPNKENSGRDLHYDNR